jgi:hypothetical protein
MAKRSRQTFQKHQKEQARRQKQNNKAARRLQSKQRRDQATPGMNRSPEEMAARQPGPQSEPARGDQIREQT